MKFTQPRLQPYKHFRGVILIKLLACIGLHSVDKYGEGLWYEFLVSIVFLTCFVLRNSSIFLTSIMQGD